MPLVFLILFTLLPTSAEAVRISLSVETVKHPDNGSIDISFSGWLAAIRDIVADCKLEPSQCSLGGSWVFEIYACGFNKPLHSGISFSQLFITGVTITDVKPGNCMVTIKAKGTGINKGLEAIFQKSIEVKKGNKSNLKIVPGEFKPTDPSKWKPKKLKDGKTVALIQGGGLRQNRSITEVNSQPLSQETQPPKPSAPTPSMHQTYGFMGDLPLSLCSISVPKARKKLSIAAVNREAPLSLTYIYSEFQENILNLDDDNELGLLTLLIPDLQEKRLQWIKEEQDNGSKNAIEQVDNYIAKMQIKCGITFRSDGDKLSLGSTKQRSAVLEISEVNLGFERKGHPGFLKLLHQKLEVNALTAIYIRGKKYSEPPTNCKSISFSDQATCLEAVYFRAEIQELGKEVNIHYLFSNDEPELVMLTYCSELKRLRDCVKNSLSKNKPLFHPME